jgi:hypothetical protein
MYSVLRTNYYYYTRCKLYKFLPLYGVENAALGAR